MSYATREPSPAPLASPVRRMRAFARYLRRPLREFLPTFAVLLATLAVGTAVFSEDAGQPGTTRPPAQAFLITAHLLLGNSLIELPDYPLQQVLFLVLPFLGLVALLDAVIRFSYHILRLDASSRDWNIAMASTLENHVILIGLGKVGLRILQQLHRLGEPVVVLERDANCPKISYARRHGIPVIIGNSRDEGILDELNIMAAKAIVPATSDDLANLEMALDARKRRPDLRVVIRLFDQELAAKVRVGFGIETAFSTSELSAPVFALSAVDPAILNSFYVGNTLLMVAHVTVGPKSALAGKPLAEALPPESIALAHRPAEGAEVMFPHATARVQQGDTLTVQTTLPGLRRLRVLANSPA